MALTDKIKAIADAIRTKTGTTDVMTLDEMPVKIAGISSGAKEPYVEESYDEDGNLIAARLVGYTKVRYKFFSDCSKLTSIELSSGIMSIENSAFAHCTNLALTELPSGITSIGSLAFIYCTKLTSIRFLGTPTSIDDSAFLACTNLTSIKVPWSEGAVKNAPWGADNATIEYDYKGE